jgi:hypothetical protein
MRDGLHRLVGASVCSLALTVFLGGFYLRTWDEVFLLFAILRVRLIMFPGLIMLWRFCVRAA